MKINEIGNIITNNMLSSKLFAYAITPEQIPQKPFGIGHKKFVFRCILLQ